MPQSRTHLYNLILPHDNLSYPSTNRLEPNLPLHNPPNPQHDHQPNIEEVKDQRPAEDDGIKRPSVRFRHLHFCHHDRPGQHPQEIRPQGLVEIPARNGSEEDGAELVVDGVEYIAPVDVLYSRLVGERRRSRADRGRDLPATFSW